MAVEDERERGRSAPRDGSATRPAGRRGGTGREDSEHAEHPVRRGPRRVSAPQAMRSASEQLEELLGRAPESVSAVRPTDEGWQADVEVEELSRVPETTSVMASYRVSLDEEGALMSYERTRRYTRGQIDRGT
ncbi:gas vesicle protein GvpO [Streptomyces sp. NPDC004749]